jgi:hydroxymethylpyrimidine/phosphomethylpyrimidine kinase
LGIDAVKIGMLANEALILAVRDMLDNVAVPIVVDPVMIATSGDALNEAGTAARLPVLFEIAKLITPNVPELAALAQREVEDEISMMEAARTLAAAHGCAVLAKGGHLPGPLVIDVLVEPDGAMICWKDTRIETRHSHGTGCTLSSAIATGLASGVGLLASIEQARAFVRAALLAAPGLGQGHGPMGHGLARAHFVP